MTHFRLYPTEDSGKDGYPKAWHSIDGGPGIKHLVREAAGHRCIRCGHPYRNGEHGRREWSPCDEQCVHGEPMRFTVTKVFPDNEAEGIVEAQWRILTVHHLDEVKLNCRWWNLAALCQRCHLTIQGRVKLHRPYFLEHSEWFKPYAAGFYAASILGEDLTRSETMERMKELLGLATAS